MIRSPRSRWARPSSSSRHWHARRCPHPPSTARSIRLASLVLGGRVDPARDPSTQSQRSFPPRASSWRPISSFNASGSRAIPALALASSDRTLVERSRPARSAASTVDSSARNGAARSHPSAMTRETASPPRPPLLPSAGSRLGIETLLPIVLEPSQMWANQNAGRSLTQTQTTEAR